jgi:hypothetical protein
MNGLEALAEMEYPGRFIISGFSKKGELVVAYGVTGRSSSSQARKFVQADDSLVIRTDVTDPKQFSEGSSALLLYPAIIPYQGMVVAGNGVQTKLVYSALLNRIHSMKGEPNPRGVKYSKTLMRASMSDAFLDSAYEYDQQYDRWIDIASFEPDDPNFTPRISLLAFGSGYIFNILRNTDGERESYNYDFAEKYENGSGHLIATYEGPNENPLPSFRRKTLPKVDIPWTNPKDAAEAIADALNPEYLVSVAAMYVAGNAVRSHIINKRGN